MGNLNNTNNSFRYVLQKGSKKYLCPQCGKKRLVRYIDSDTGSYLPEIYGRCDRESKCSYHRNPYQDGYKKDISENGNKVTGVTKVTFPKQILFHAYSNSAIKTKTVFFNYETFKQTLQPSLYEKNTFVQNLLTCVKFPFEIEDVKEVIQLYQIGTINNGYRDGAVTFPFIDIMKNIRVIQVKQFNKANHTISTDFLHTIIRNENMKNNLEQPSWLAEYLNQEKYVTCLFGEHLLGQYSSNPVALVEAPKTAIYCTLYFGVPKNPENLVWLAVYNKSSFSFDKMQVLKGKDVIVFPDLSNCGKTFIEWKSKANEIEKKLPGTKFIFSDLLENFASDTDKINGNDLADYLIELDWRKFRRNDNKMDSNVLENDLNIQNSLINEPSLVVNNKFRKYINENESRIQTIGDIFDMYRSMGYNKLPANCSGIRAGNWESTKY